MKIAFRISKFIFQTHRASKGIKISNEIFCVAGFSGLNSLFFLLFSAFEQLVQELG